MDDRMKIMERLERQLYTHNCPSCKSKTYCAMNAGKSSNLCWCMFEDSTINPDTSLEECLCRDCLRGNKEE